MEEQLIPNRSLTLMVLAGLVLTGIALLTGMIGGGERRVAGRDAGVNVGVNAGANAGGSAGADAGAEVSRTRGDGVGDDRRAEAVIGGTRFSLEIARDAATQERGLSGRSQIDASGGMLFVFAEVEMQAFLMRDCAIPIDLLYLDEAGKVLNVYAMQPEAPRSGTERAGDAAGEAAYVSRLTSYVSAAPVAFAIELRGGTAAKLGVRKDDVVELQRFIRSAAARNR